MFFRDPEIKAEAVWTGPRLKRSTGFARREGPGARILSEGGEWRRVPSPLGPADSLMTHCADPLGAPELLVLRERMRAWRFYDHLRTDRDAPARRPQVGTRTPVLAGDGADLAAALQTIREIGDARGPRRRRRRRLSGRRDRRSRTGTDCSTSRCASPACCGRSAPRNCPRARCAISCWWRRCSSPGRRRCWC